MVAAVATGSVVLGDKEKPELTSDLCADHTVDLAELVADKQAGWVASYQSLDTSVKPAESRVEGVPMKFIPANTRGDLITRTAVTHSHRHIL
mgnify:CR=1 FL=1